MKSAFRPILLLAVLCYSPALTLACMLCPGKGPPLAKEIYDAKLVVFGKITGFKDVPSFEAAEAALKVLDKKKIDEL